jgi:uncharacterized protein (DUF427 family)
MRIAQCFAPSIRAEIKMNNPAPGFSKHPGYEVNIEPLNAEIVIKVGDLTIASSQQALAVTETKHRPVWYLPMQDVNAALLVETDTQTYCPFKGYARYWSIKHGDEVIEDAIWGYAAPYDECEALAEFVSFYTNKVDLLIDGVQANKEGPGWTD